MRPTASTETGALHLEEVGLGGRLAEDRLRRGHGRGYQLEIAHRGCGGSRFLPLLLKHELLKVPLDLRGGHRALVMSALLLQKF